jgi:hypothetical protein
MNRTTGTPSTVTALFLAALTLTACGGSDAPDEAPPAEDAPAPEAAAEAPEAAPAPTAAS